MERNYVTIDVPNMISITIMALVGLWVISLAATLGGKYFARAG